MSDPSVHASCVALDGLGVLIRGASGAGKSRLAQIVILRAPLYERTARLVADDRVLLERRGDTLMARAPDALAGLIEIRSLGIARLPPLAECAVRLVVDLVAERSVPRFPSAEERSVGLDGVTLPRVFASSPEMAFDVVLTRFGHNHFTLDGHEPLAPRHQDGNTALS